jgi:hypothetical protein
MMHLRWDVAAVLVRRRGRRDRLSESEHREGVLAALIDHVVKRPVAEQRDYLSMRMAVPNRWTSPIFTKCGAGRIFLAEQVRAVRMLSSSSQIADRVSPRS